MSNTITFPLLGFILSVFFSTAAYVKIWISSARPLQLMEPSFMQAWICVSKWWYMPFLIALPSLNLNLLRGRCGLGRMVAGFTTTYANQCLSPLMLWVQISIRVRFTTLCDKVCQWFSPGLSVSSTNKTDRHNISEILLKVVLNTIKQTLFHTF